ncbi:DUF2948 family protein [Hyphomonas atlantica]|uniref:DUF2948 domain-containing protein n=1 Tax=Hyphomonas atlantica TaxID=1280948 RepID=A0A059E181_9PROT|nr:DUF2948 family protein [Hyphomonas atlantica]KCZ61416.1 hypothetical protein HY36_16725 [Hyphomonas atlantica]HAE93491.1 DUF2948 domain-containing protein [Hyphomonas atlantica]HBH45400.1 DUF2948 domain-containing protein [Hyphomonas atlantica]|tara:strand:+ start:3078 stop:3527 length:450 start_codon:yes stop_codon:yes gene_type:complete
MADQTSLRLLAETAEDLEVISAAIQDSVVKAGNLKYESRRNRFTLEINRFRWEAGAKRGDGERVRSLLAFDGVMGVKTRAVNKIDPEMILSLLQVSFTPADEPPGGKVTLLFAGDGEIELDVEVLDATLLDSDYVWPTRHLPNHERRRR